MLGSYVDIYDCSKWTRLPCDKLLQISPGSEWLSSMLSAYRGECFVPPGWRNQICMLLGSGRSLLIGWDPRSSNTRVQFGGTSCDWRWDAHLVTRNKTDLDSLIHQCSSPSRRLVHGDNLLRSSNLTSCNASFLDPRDSPTELHVDVSKIPIIQWDPFNTRTKPSSHSPILGIHTLVP